MLKTKQKQKQKNDKSHMKSIILKQMQGWRFSNIYFIFDLEIEEWRMDFIIHPRLKAKSTGNSEFQAILQSRQSS